ncbi:ABC transporter-related protein [Chloroherpeton thalassium ATCC 35110]|uniref:ABC transporter-related protein n=1 Tax=Chloroherpeton thalassium (strain ATCC 35110 / GB-78) TaxID=517418 RepID=B3QX55_CHLT3|nr:ABC transporter ATP-binding protein [Chloroherpeton thalassium]ACF14865.1 ABC transporter-related protein [Chloroherpeton thalassium ATCC 35110]
MSILISNLTKHYTKNQAENPTLSISNLAIEDGDAVAIVGKSGSGKSTLLNLIAGIVTPESGQIVVKGTDITRLSESKRDLFRAENIGYVFQTFNLIQGLSALENVLLAMNFCGKVKQPEARAKILLERVGLGEKLHKKPSQLSVGEQQRVAQARAIANEPHIILADEPTANLDDKNTEVVMNLLEEFSRENGRILILVTHEKEVAERFPKQLELESINQSVGR